MNSDWNQGILTELEKRYQQPLQIEVEYLDLVEDPRHEFSARWTELLRSKYSWKRVDLVVPVYDSALQYVLDNREQVFPGVPVVFCSATEELARKAVQQPSVTGVAFQTNSAQTLAFIRQLLPETRQLFVVAGASDSDRKLLKTVRKSMPASEDALKLRYWDGFDLTILRKVLPKEDPRSAMLILTCDRDVPGSYFTTVDYTKRISELAHFPVFSLFESSLGTGVMGGYVVSPSRQGAMAGRMAARVLSGERPESMPIAGLGSNFVALDARQLERFRVPKSRIPQNADVRFRDVIDWRRVTRYLLTGAAAIALQSVLIGFLLVNRARRVRAEQEARALAGMILTAQEDERSRVARELHDDLSQRLAVASLDVAILEQKLADKATTTDVFARLKQGLVTLCRDVHQLSHRMHSSVLEDLGLEAALRSECNSARERHDLSVDFLSEGVPARVPHGVSVCLYRILQEAIRNAVKHSQATGVHVVLKHDGQQLRLEIRDDGVGFDVDQASGVQQGADGTKGLGIASLKERVRLVGGTIRIHSAPLAGVTIDVQVPCHVSSA